MYTNVSIIRDTNIIAKKKANLSKSITNEELEMIVRELVIYRDNKKCIELIKSFEKPVLNKYNLKARLAIAMESQIYISKREIILMELLY